MRSQREEAKTGRDLIEELIGEECDNDHTHKPEGSYEILNEIVVDRGPSGSQYSKLLPTACLIPPSGSNPLT